MRALLGVWVSVVLPWCPPVVSIIYLHPALGAPQQNVQAWGVTVAARLARLDQPAGLVEHLVSSEGLGHEEHAVRREGQSRDQGIHFCHISWLVNDKFKIGCTRVTQELQDRQVYAASVGYARVDELGRDVELMRQESALYVGQWGKTGRLDLDGKAGFPQ